MRRTHSARVPALVTAAAVLSLSLVAAPDTALARRAEPKVVQDLHWGEVLFYFYQQDYFAAITRLRAARRLQQLPHHDAEGELLLGGLYLSYGNHNEAIYSVTRHALQLQNDVNRPRTFSATGCRRHHPKLDSVNGQADSTHGQQRKELQIQLTEPRSPRPAH